MSDLAKDIDNEIFRRTFENGSHDPRARGVSAVWERTSDPASAATRRISKPDPLVGPTHKLATKRGYPLAAPVTQKESSPKTNGDSTQRNPNTTTTEELFALDRELEDHLQQVSTMLDSLPFPADCTTSRVVASLVGEEGWLAVLRSRITNLKAHEVQIQTLKDAMLERIGDTMEAITDCLRILQSREQARTPPSRVISTGWSLIPVRRQRMS